MTDDPEIQNKLMEYEERIAQLEEEIENTKQNWNILALLMFLYYFLGFYRA